MTNTSIQEPVKLSDHEMRRLSQSPQYKARAMVMAVVAGACFVGAGAYFAIALSGVLAPPPPAPQGFPVWPILALVVLTQIPAQVIVTAKSLKEARTSAADFDQAAGRSLPIFIVALAFAESDCIYGLVSIILHAPMVFAYGLMAFGVVHLILTVAILWPRLKTLMLTRLAAEERQTQTGGGW